MGRHADHSQDATLWLKKITFFPSFRNLKKKKLPLLEFHVLLSNKTETWFFLGHYQVSTSHMFWGFTKCFFPCQYAPSSIEIKISYHFYFDVSMECHASSFQFWLFYRVPNTSHIKSLITVEIECTLKQISNNFLYFVSRRYLQEELADADSRPPA